MLKKAYGTLVFLQMNDTGASAFAVGEQRGREVSESGTETKHFSPRGSRSILGQSR